MPLTNSILDMDTIKPNQLVCRRAVGSQILRGLAFGLSSMAIQKNSVAAHAHTPVRGEELTWMPGQAFKVLNPGNVIGNSFSTVRLMAMVGAPVASSEISLLSRLRWQWKHGAGVQLHGAHVHDGQRQLHFFPASTLISGQVALQPVVAIQQQLMVVFDIGFSDSDRELHWHSLECEFA